MTLFGFDWWPILDEEKNTGLIVCAMIVVLVLGIAITKYLYRSKKFELEIEFKRDMVDRGMSPDEIERVLAATSPVDTCKKPTATKDLKATELYVKH